MLAIFFGSHALKGNPLLIIRVKISNLILFVISRNMERYTLEITRLGFNEGEAEVDDYETREAQDS